MYTFMSSNDTIKQRRTGCPIMNQNSNNIWRLEMKICSRVQVWQMLKRGRALLTWSWSTSPAASAILRLNQPPSRYQTTIILSSNWPHRSLATWNSLLPFSVVSLSVGTCPFPIEIKSTNPGKPGILWGLQRTQHRGKRRRGWELPRRRRGGGRGGHLRQQQHGELQEIALQICLCLQVYLNDMDPDEVKCVPEKTVVSSSTGGL